MTRTLAEMAKDQNRLSDLFTEYTPRFEAASGASTDRKIQLSREFARKLDDFGGNFAAREQALRRDGEAMATSYLHRIEGASAGPELSEFRATIAEMRDVTMGSRASTSGWREAIVALRTQNLQQAINEVLDRLILTATKVISDFDRTVRFATDAMALIVAKTAEAEAAARAAEDLTDQSSSGSVVE